MFQTRKKSENWPVIRSVYCLCLLFFVLGKVSGQYRIPFTNYTMKEGLVQNQVNDICQDHKGYIWLATAGGVSRFDGRNFVNYTVSDGLPTNMVSELLIDRRNRIWMATYGGGLTVFDGKTFRTYTIEDGLVSNYLMTRDFCKILMEDSQGNIWCRGNDEGISVISETGVFTYHTGNGFTAGRVTCMKEDRRGRILCGTTLGLSVLHQGKIEHHTFGKQGISNMIINRKGEVWVFGAQAAQWLDDQSFIYHEFPMSGMANTAGYDSRDRLWIATNEAELYIFDEGKFTSVHSPEEVLYKIYEDSGKNIWLMPRHNGVYRLSGDKMEHYGHQYGLLDDAINCVFEDNEGNVWIGTESGVSMYGKVIFETLTMESGFPSNHIQCVTTDSIGNIWCAPDNHGLVKINGQQMFFFESTVKEKNAQTNAINSIAPVGNNLILGSLGAGVGRFSNGQFIFDLQKTDDYVSNILVLTDNEYWVASLEGLIHVRGKNVRCYTVADGLPDDDVFFLARDNQGKIWCTTLAGLSVFNGEHFVNYTVENGLPNNICTDIAIDRYGAVWVGTENGLCRITEKGGQPEFKVYTTKDGLASNSILLVHADRSDRLWVGYLGGLNTIDLKTGDIANYTEADGFRALDCYSGAAVTDAQGNVWFGTVEGLVKYNPKADIVRTTPPRTYITGVSLSDGSNIARFADSISTQTGLPENLVLPYHQNNIRIDWIGIHLTIPSKNKYRFTLEGYDKTWHETSSDIFREYRLSPGRYTFKVTACNNDGVWNPVPVEYSFKVRPPWWATVIAFIVYALLLAMFIYFYVRWRERQLIEKNRILEEKVYERTLEIEIQKQNILEVNKMLKEHKNELIVQRDTVTAQRDKIAGQRREILDSIQYAKRIQKATMPNADEMRMILYDHFIFFRPRDIVSGDYYWATRKDNKSVAVVADCTGHGVPGAFMSMIGISFLNEIVLKREIKTASEILNELRTNVKFVLSQTGTIGEQRDGMDMSLCIIDYEAMELQYAGAYNSLYLIRKGELIEHKADRMPVGIYIHGREKDFTNHVISLQHDDMLYTFTDGYVDQFGGENNSKFKTSPFKQLLTRISTTPTEHQRESLIETHDQWKGAGFQLDDILVMGIRIR